MKEKEQVEIIERYINGQLDPDERSDFEKRLQSDPILAHKTSSYRNSFVSHISAGGSKLKHGLIAVGKRGTKLSKRMVELNQKKNAIKVIGIFLVLLISGISLIFIFDKSPNYAALFNQYYDESLLEHPLLKDAELVEDYGIQHYQNRDFDRAIPALHKEIIAKPGDARLYLYLGLSYLESNVDDKAKLYFEKAEGLSDGKYRNSAIWYLALTQIKLSQIQPAKENLMVLINKSGDNPYKVKAQKLLEEL